MPLLSPIVFQIFVLPRLIRTLKARHSIKLDQLERLSHLSTSAENLDNVLQDMSYSIESLSGVPEASLGNFEAPENENSPPKTYRNLIRAILSSAEGTQMSASEIASKAKTVFNVPEDDLEVEVRLSGHHASAYLMYATAFDPTRTYTSTIF